MYNFWNLLDTFKTQWNRIRIIFQQKTDLIDWKFNSPAYILTALVVVFLWKPFTYLIQEVIMMLDVCKRDFLVLIKRLELFSKLETSDVK